MFVCMLFSLILDSAVSLSAGIHSAGDLVSETLVRIPRSAEENIACLCQSIEINNKHVYRQSQVRKPTGGGVEWAECSLIIRGRAVEFKTFSLILDSSVGLSASIQSAGDLVSETLGSNHAFSRGRQLPSFRFE